MVTHVRLWRALCLMLILAFVAACTNQPTGAPSEPLAAASTSVAASSSSTATATAAPSATPGAWTFPADSRIAGVDVGGRTPEVALKLVSLGLNHYQQPIPLQAVDSPAEDAPLLKPYRVGIAPDVAQLVAEAEAVARKGEPVDLAWTPELDVEQLRAELETLASAFEQPAISEIITDSEAITQTFTFRAQPGTALDIDATAELLTSRLLDPSQPLTETAVISTTPAPERDLVELERVLNAHLEYWKGVGAIYVHDLETGETLGINENSVFSGASVMKVPIMMYVYSKLGKLDEQQREWMENVIVNSDNLDANALLAAAVGGQGTEAALEGVNEMTTMLEGLGLEHTYQLIPYESAEWLIQQSKFPKGGPAREGEPPYTAADSYLRTTPREMGELFVMLAQCADGQGPLLEKYSDTITEALCDEMMAWLERPHDEERMVAGLPPGTRIAHKGGWIDDMQSDVGIVSSPGGRYVAAIYIWRPDGYVTNVHAAPSPYLGDFSHTIYSFFNPEPIED